MNEITYFILGLGLGVVGTSLWLGTKIKDLKNVILDRPYDTGIGESSPITTKVLTTEFCVPTISNFILTSSK